MSSRPAHPSSSVDHRIDPAHGPKQTASQDEERCLRQLAENIRAVFWMTDATASRLLYISPAYDEVWGRPRDGLYRNPKTWQEAIHPEDRQKAARVFEQFLRDGRSYEQEYRVVRPDGSVRWVRDRAFPVRDASGQLERVAGLAEDITPQKHKDEELRRHMRQQEVIAVLGRSALADADPQALLDGAARLVAQALKVEYAAVWELLPDGAKLRMCAGEGWRGAVVGSHTAAAGADSPVGSALLSNEPTAVDDLNAPGGPAADPVLQAHGVVSALSVPVGGPGRRFGVLAAYAARRQTFPLEDRLFMQAVAHVLAEAAARREMEEALRGSKRFSQAVLNSLDAHVAVLDQRGVILAVNEAWERFGRENGCGALARCGVGANYLEACARQEGDDGGNDAARGVRAVLDGLLPLFTHEYPCHTPNRRRWFMLRATPCETRRGCAVAAHIDITERKLAEEALRDANRRKDEFLSVLAHELRNPLAPLRNALEVLRQPGVGGPTVDYVRDMMDRQVRHLTRLVEDLIDVSRLTSGRIELRTEMVDVAPLLMRAADAARPFIEQGRHRLAVAAPPEPLRVEGDAARLEQVLCNLLHNAAKYTDPGGSIRLTARREGNQAVLVVKDTGVGIDAGMLPHVFDPLVQAERRLDRSRGGVGVGLTLVRKLVELHGGSVEARSEGPGRGSEFLIRLPCLAEAPTGTAVARNAPRRAPVAVPTHRVLVVDDNPDAAESLSMLLKLLGQEVRVSHDGPAALAVAREFRPSVAFLDIGMPGMDGHELARRLRGEPELRAMLLVALTGWGQEEDRRRSLAAGFDHHLTKPAPLEMLCQLLLS